MIRCSPEIKDKSKMSKIIANTSINKHHGIVSRQRRKKSTRITDIVIPTVNQSNDSTIGLFANCVSNSNVIDSTKPLL